MNAPTNKRYRDPTIVRQVELGIREVLVNPDPLAPARRLHTIYHEAPRENMVPWRETYFTLAMEGNIHCLRALVFSGERLATNKVLSAIFEGTLPIDQSLWALDFYLRKGFTHAIPAASAFVRRPDVSDQDKNEISGLIALVIAGSPPGLPYGF